MAPCPISDCEEMSVTTSSGLMRIHGLRGGLRGALSGTPAAPADDAVAPDSSASINEPISKPPPAATAVVRKIRRDMPLLFIYPLLSRRRSPLPAAISAPSGDLRRAMNCLANPRIGPAPA